MMDGDSPAHTDDDLLTGDALAANEQWAAALGFWDSVAGESDAQRSAVHDRLRWMNREAGLEPPSRGSGRSSLLTGAAAGAIGGTACILLAGTPGSAWANTLAAVAWGLYVMSAALVLIAARGTAYDTYDDARRMAGRSAERLMARSQANEDTR